MNTRGIIGRRIVAIRQEKVFANSAEWLHSVTEIELDNGTILRPHTIELDSGADYGLTFVVVRKPKGGGSCGPT